MLLDPKGNYFMADMNRLEDTQDLSDYFTIDTAAKEMGLSIQRTRQLIDIALKKRVVPRLVKNRGIKNFYHPDMIGKILEAYNSGKLTDGVVRRRIGNPEGRLDRRALKHAKLLLEVPVFDEQDSQILLKRFGSKEGIVKFLQEKLKEGYKDTRSELERLEQEFNDRRAKILGTR